MNCNPWTVNKVEKCTIFQNTKYLFLIFFSLVFLFRAVLNCSQLSCHKKRRVQICYSCCCIVRRTKNEITFLANTQSKVHQPTANNDPTAKDIARASSSDSCTYKWYIASYSCTIGTTTINRYTRASHVFIVYEVSQVDSTIYIGKRPHNFEVAVLYKHIFFHYPFKLLLQHQVHANRVNIIAPKHKPGFDLMTA